jgi:hypothetical protein
MKRGQHWLLNDTDAKHYGLLLSNAVRHLPIGRAQVAFDFSMLAVGVVMYEGPRIAMDKWLRDHPQQASRGPAQVFQFTPNTAQARPANGTAAAPETPDIHPEPPDPASPEAMH